MIASLEGTLALVTSEALVVSVGGVGFLVHAPRRLLESLPEPGSQIRLHTHLAVREDALQLFGFETPEERELFLMLKSVSGVGPKTALAVISELPLAEVVVAIVGQEPRRLATAPGVGKKTAERIILELREKLQDWQLALPEASRTHDPVRSEAELALLSLGYTRDEASRALAQARSSDAEGKIREALVYLSRLGG